MIHPGLHTDRQEAGGRGGEAGADGDGDKLETYTHTRTRGASEWSLVPFHKSETGRDPIPVRDPSPKPKGRPILPPSFPRVCIVSNV
jgi:hypothetical protein